MYIQRILTGTYSLTLSRTYYSLSLPQIVTILVDYAFNVQVFGIFRDVFLFALRYVDYFFIEIKAYKYTLLSVGGSSIDTYSLACLPTHLLTHSPTHLLVLGLYLERIVCLQLKNKVDFTYNEKRWMCGFLTIKTITPTYSPTHSLYSPTHLLTYSLNSKRKRSKGEAAIDNYNIIQMKSLSSASAAVEVVNESVTDCNDDDEDLTPDVGTVENPVAINGEDNEVEFEYDVYGRKEDDVAAANDIM